MALSLGHPHQIRFTVTDLERSAKFYTEVLGLQVALAELPPPGHEHHDELAEAVQGGTILTNGSMLIGLRPVAEGRAGDKFDPFRVGLDHVSFGLDSRAELEDAARKLDELGVDHGPIRELQSFQLRIDHYTPEEEARVQGVGGRTGRAPRSRSSTSSRARFTSSTAPGSTVNACAIVGGT